MKRFSEAEKQTNWDTREAGVPVKRIARHLARQNVSLRKFIADAGGKPASPRQRSEAATSPRRTRGDLPGPGGGGLHPGYCRCPGPVSFDGVPGGERQRGAKENIGPWWLISGLPRTLPPKRAKLTQCRRLRGIVERRTRGPVVARADLGVVGFAAPRSPGDVRVPSDHLPVTVRPEPRSVAQRAPFMPAHRPGHATGQGVHQRQRRPRPAQEHGDVGSSDSGGVGPLSERRSSRGRASWVCRRRAGHGSGSSRSCGSRSRCA